MTPVRTICLGFLGVIGVGTLLLWLPVTHTSGQWGSLLTALFMATSAVCVTGLGVVDVGSYYNALGQGILLGLIQIGGLGYMTANTLLLLLLGRRFGLKDKLALQQSMDRPTLGGSLYLLRSILSLTVVIELTGVLVLVVGFAPRYGWSQGLWLALFHSISAFNNAGFSLFPNSLVEYRGSGIVVVGVTLLVILGGIGYTVIMEGFVWLRDALRRRSQELTDRMFFSLNTRIVTTTSLALLVLGTLAFGVLEWNKALGGMPWQERLLAAWFQSVTTRTAGFHTVETSRLSTAALCLTIVLMFIGASPGGTGGGIKTTTMRVMASCTQAVLRGKEEVVLYERQIPLSLVLKAVAVVFGSLGVVMGATLLITLLEQDLDFLKLLFEVVSAFATVGLSTGITAELQGWSQLVIIVTMYIGRVGILTLMSATLKESSPSRIHYPEESFLVG
ncbi:MAG: TrkH family potassium uptake protein [Thermostichales cyanobacterium BF4_bins_65]